MLSPSRARVALTLATVVSVALLGGCASEGPTDAQRHSWSDWANEIVEASGGGVGAVMSPDASGEGVRQDFASPQKLTSVELRCIGADRATFTLHYTSADGSVTTLTQDIVCQDGAYRTPIAVPTAVGELSAFAATATSPDGEGYWLAIPQQ